MARISTGQHARCRGSRHAMVTVPRCLLALAALLGAGSCARAVAAEAGQSVSVTIGVKWRQQSDLDRLLRDLADPGSPQFGRYLTAEEFDRRFGPSAATHRAVTDLVKEQGLTITGISRSRLFVTAAGWVGDATRTRTELIEHLRQLTNEERVYCDVVSDAAERAPGMAAGSAGAAAPTLRSPLRGPLLPPQSGAPYRPADIATAYGFQRLYGARARAPSGRESTIAIATAFGFHWSDLEAFWRHAGIQRDRDGVELRWVGGFTQEVHAESTVDVQWASAMAPDARILVYAGPDAGGDTFLQLYDRIVADNDAAIMTTSWGACEREFGHTYLEQAHAIFQRAAAQGITVLAASGDNGAYGCGGSTLDVDFPASDPYVLAVGGTSLPPDGGEEQAWGGSGGGVSAKWPAPPWQMRAEANRVLPDVAFHADPATGFVATFDGRPAVFGGTSIAAPCWAALVALINEQRAHSGRGPLGLAAPELCEVAVSTQQAPRAFRDITSGDNGAYSAAPGWDFSTGWGSPRAYGLAQALSTWTPPPPAPPEVTQTLFLSPVSPSATGAVRLLFSRRCLQTNLRLQARSVAPGSYRLHVDGTPVASFDVDDGGRAWLDVPAVDPRGHAVTLTDAASILVFLGAFDASTSPPIRLRSPLTNTGVIGAATGSLVYRSVHGRERLGLRVYGLPPGPYDVQVGDQTILPVVLAADRTSARISFDSSGLAGLPLSVSPLCGTLTVARDDVPVLQAPRLVPSAGHCAP